MHSIRIIGPGRAGTSLAAALSARGWAFAGFLGRHDEVARAAEGVDLLVIATPDDAVADVAAAVSPVPGTTLVHLSGSLGLDAAGAASPAGGGAPSGAAAQRRGRCRPPLLGRDVRRGRRPDGAGHGGLPQGPGGRGGRRGPGGLPRRRLHRGQPRRGAPRPGGAGRRLRRAGPRVVPPVDPGCRRRRGGARGRSRARPARPDAATGRRSAAISTPCPSPSAPVTRPGRRWPPAWPRRTPPPRTPPSRTQPPRTPPSRTQPPRTPLRRPSRRAV